MKGRYATKASKRLNHNVVIDVFDTFFRVWIEPCPKYKFGAWLELGFDGSITEVYNRQGDTEVRTKL